MSHNHFIGTLLGIKDKNIKVDEDNWLKEDVRNGLRCKIISATLTYIPKACKCCGYVNDGSIVKNGTKLTHPLLLDMAGCPTYLELKKQRFLCRECGQTFIAETTMVKKRCHISNDVKHSIAVQGNRTISK